MTAAARVLDAYVSGIPAHPYAAFHTKSAQIVERDVALGRARLVQPQHRMKHWIVVDVDSPQAGLAWESVDLPPNLIVRNREGDRAGYAHLYYWLDRPVFVDPMRPANAAVKLYNLARGGLTAALNGDPAYAGVMGKNPLNDNFFVATSPRVQPYQLGEIADRVPLYATSRRADNEHGRHCTVFDSVRFWAYRNKHRFRDLLSFRTATREQVDAINDTFLHGLTESELRSLAKSISTWTWNRYTGSQRGIMGLPVDMDLTEKQSRGASYTAGIKTAKTLAAIRSARELNPTATQVEIAAATGLGIATVKRHWTASTAYRP